MEQKLYQYTSKVYLSKTLQVIAIDDKEAQAALAQLVAEETTEGWNIEDLALRRKPIDLC